MQLYDVKLVWRAYTYNSLFQYPLGVLQDK